MARGILRLRGFYGGVSFICETYKKNPDRVSDWEMVEVASWELENEVAMLERDVKQCETGKVESI
jgi:hypothetical protein